MDHTTIKFRFNTKTGVLDIPAFDFSFLFSALEFYTTDGDKKDNAMYTALFAEHMTAAFFYLFNHNNNSTDNYDIVQLNSCGC